MGNIAVLCQDNKINTIIAQCCSQNNNTFQPVFLKDTGSFVQFLNYELPEIDIVFYSDHSNDINNAFELIKDDPWLHFGGSIIIYENQNEKELSTRLQGVNIIALIQKDNLSDYLSQVLQVLIQNRSILFQRDIHALLQSNLSGTFVIENDPFDAMTYSNLLTNFLFNANLLNLEKKYDFNVALSELIINGIEHGNCNITYNEKRKLLEQNVDMMAYIKEKSSYPEIQKKNVKLIYKINPKQSHIKIKDEGDGFDWRSFQGKSNNANEGESLGRGIAIANHYLNDLKYNEKGNEVSFTINHSDHESNVIPRVFTDNPEIMVKTGDSIFEEGEKSSHLYYIISGEFDIKSHGKTISTLTKADIFLGEMSFLLNNRRSATVIAASDGTLIKISKEDFINAIKSEPHYGIFLARLLAQRLAQLHDFTI